MNFLKFSPKFSDLKNIGVILFMTVFLTILGIAGFKLYQQTQPSTDESKLIKDNPFVPDANQPTDAIEGNTYTFELHKVTPEFIEQAKERHR